LACNTNTSELYLVGSRLLSELLGHLFCSWYFVVLFTSYGQNAGCYFQFNCHCFFQNYFHLIFHCRPIIRLYTVRSTNDIAGCTALKYSATIFTVFNVQGPVHRKNIPFDIFPTRCNITQFSYFWKTALYNVNSQTAVNNHN